MSCPLGTDNGKKPEGNNSTCCPKDQVFNGTKCVPGNTKNLETCPSGWGCQGYGEGAQCYDINYGVLTCGGGAVSSTDGNTKILEDVPQPEQIMVCCYGETQV